MFSLWRFASYQLSSYHPSCGRGRERWEDYSLSFCITRNLFPAVGRRELCFWRGCGSRIWMMESFLIHRRQPALEAPNKFQSKMDVLNFSIAKLWEDINFPTEASATIILHFRAVFVSQSCATLQKNLVPRQPNVKNFLPMTLFMPASSISLPWNFHSINCWKLDYIPMSRKPRDGPVRVEQLDWSSVKAHR